MKIVTKSTFPKNCTNTQGTRVGPGGRNRKQAVKKLEVQGVSKKVDLCVFVPVVEKITVPRISYLIIWEYF